MQEEQPSAEALYFEGVAFGKQAQLAAAAACYRRALALRPDFAEAQNNLGVTLIAQGQALEAVACYRNALAVHDDFPQAHCNLGSALLQLGEIEAAVTRFRQALALQPDYADAHFNLATGLRQCGATHLDAAIASYRAALAANEGFARAHTGLGAALLEKGEVAAAIACHQRALALEPDLAEAHNNLATALDAQDEVAEAVRSYRRAIKINPGFAEAHNNLGLALRRLGYLAEAIVCHRRSLELRPDYAETHVNIGMAMLASGEFASGWKEFEWRWKKWKTRFEQPQWHGEPGAGRRLLIRLEGGYGDMLQFCRYAPMAKARGFGRVYLQVQAPLARLLRCLPSVDAVVAHGEALPGFDVHCPNMSLPGAFGTTLATIPGQTPYLCADAGQVVAWRQRLAELAPSGLRVGLVWAGNSATPSDRQRSISVERLAPLWTVPGVTFVSLQKTAQRAVDAPMIDVMGEMEDFADTAALVANLDLVIAVDTAVAHLAAALGRPVWMLDRFDSCWRWLRNRRDSPWYPSLRIYRQPSLGAWDSVLSEVVRDLGQLVTSDSPRLAKAFDG